MTDKINLAQKFAMFNETWSPKVVADLNDSYIKLAKLQGEFVWHQHEHEDELFIVVKGRLLMKFRDREVWIAEGELLVVPKGVEHLPIAPEEVQIILIEPKGTLHSGDVETERTVSIADQTRI